MRIFEIDKTLIEVESNMISTNTSFDDRIRMYEFTHEGVARDEILEVCKTLPYTEFKIILDFSLHDFPILYSDYLEIQKLSNNFFIISCNWRIIEHENHAFFDPKLYKFDSQKEIFKKQVDMMSFLYTKNIGYIKPKKFINLTNHIRRERVQMLDSIYSHKNDGYIAFPNPNEIDDEVRGCDESTGGWIATNLLLENSNFKTDLPIRFDFKKSTSNSGEHLNDSFVIENDETVIAKELENVGLEFNYGMYLTSYLDIFSETYYSKNWEDDEYVDNLIHSSEKTINPLWAHLPLLCLDSKDKMMYMEKFGFSFECPLHTPKYIDEMEPSDEKTKAFNEFVVDILKKDITEIHDIYIKYYLEFQHNFHIMTTRFTREFVNQKIQLWLENTYQH